MTAKNISIAQWKQANLLLLAGVLTVLVVSNPALAQSTYIFQPAASAPEASRLWQEPNNWLNTVTSSNFVPNAEFNEIAVIDNGATAVLTVSTPNNGEQSVVTPGEIRLLNGGLDIRSTGALHSKAITSGNGTSTGHVIIGGTQPANLRIASGGSLMADGDVTLASTANYALGISGPTNAGVFSTLGAAQVAGSLALEFSGFTPTAGTSWTVIEASNITGAFDSVVASGSLGFNQSVSVAPADLGGGRFGINATIEEVLVLEVNRDSGLVTMKHPGTSTIMMDGYFVGSAGGLLSANPNEWNSLKEGGQLGSDWIETTQTPNNIAELKIGADATFGNNIVLGNIYKPLAGTFGEDFDDLEFGLRRASDGAQFSGVIQYVGTTVNSLVLQLDPSGTGDAFLRNTSNTTVQIDAYEILSPSGSLSTTGWMSLDDQNGSGNTWLEATNNDATILAEFDAEGFTTIAPGAAINLGQLFTGATEDLAFNFLMQGDEEGTTGVVIYEPFEAGSGDFDGDSDVDGHDFLLWQRGSSPNPLSPSDLAAWQASYGSSSVANTSAVPEPHAIVLCCLAMLGSVLDRRNR